VSQSFFVLGKSMRDAENDAKKTAPEWCLCNWVRCTDAWGDLGEGNTLALFHDEKKGMYRVEMELAAECVDLVALFCELKFAQKWCPFVKLSERVMDTDYVMADTVVYRMVLHPACFFIIGVIVLYLKQTNDFTDSPMNIKCEDMHRSKTQTTSSSYVAFETFVVEFERDTLQEKTCCSFEIRFLNNFFFVPSLLLFVVCREMLACFVKQWTCSARLLHVRSLDLFALGKQVDRNAAHYARISEHIRRK